MMRERKISTHVYAAMSVILIGLMVVKISEIFRHGQEIKIEVKDDEEEVSEERKRRRRRRTGLTRALVMCLYLSFDKQI